MIRLYTLLGILLLGLAACAPRLRADGEVLPTSLPATASPTETSAAPLPTGTASAEISPWSGDPLTKIISASFCCGRVSRSVTLNYIPAGQIWGDGRILLAQVGTDGKRQVLEGRLAPEQMSELIDYGIDQGFFEWDERYISPNAPTDLPAKCVTIQLVEQTRKVCEYYEGAPGAFHTLFEKIAGGAGATGRPYVPGRAYLTATLFDGTAQAAPGTDFIEWDAERLGFSLAQATGGIWIDSVPVVKQAWDAVNANAWQPVVRQGGEFYLLSLQLPGVSMTEPPAP